MPIDKYGGFVHPYFSRTVVEDEERSEIVGAPKKEQFYEFMVNLYGFEKDTYFVCQYDGEEGKITKVTSPNSKDMFILNQGKPVIGHDLVFKDIKKKDLIVIYPVNRGKPKTYSFTIKKMIGKNVEVFTNNLKLKSYPFRTFKWLFETGKIVKADVSPSNITLNGTKVNSLDNVELKMWDTILFSPLISFFEANLVIRCPIKEN